MVRFFLNSSSCIKITLPVGPNFDSDSIFTYLISCFRISQIGDFNVAEMPLERENGIVIKEDQEVIVKLAAAEAAAEKKCSESGTCSLPPTQHLKIRVMFATL